MVCFPSGVKILSLHRERLDEFGVEPISCSIYVVGAGPEGKGTVARGLPLTSI